MRLNIGDSTGIAFVHPLDEETAENPRIFVKSHYPCELFREQVKERVLGNDVVARIDEMSQTTIHKIASAA